MATITQTNLQTAGETCYESREISNSCQPEKKVENQENTGVCPVLRATAALAYHYFCKILGPSDEGGYF